MPTEDFTTTLQNWAEVFMHHSMRNMLRFSRRSGLSMSQIGALYHIKDECCSGVSNLGDRLGVTSAAASQLLDRLVQQGLVSRSEDPDDRRVKKFVMTSKGKQLVQQSIHARLDWLNELSEKFTADEKDQVSDALRILIEKSMQLELPAELEE